MLELIGTALGGILSGGATGLLGVVLQRFADFKNKQLDLQHQERQYTHELSMRDKDAAIMAQEWAARTRVAEVEAGAQVDVADAEAFAASYRLEPAAYSGNAKPTKAQAWVLVILDAMRGSVRPLLTVYLCVITTMMYRDARALLGSAHTADQAFELTKLIVWTVLYLTTTCVLWWFGTRNKQAAPKL